VSFRDWRLRVQDILEAIASIQQRTSGMTVENLMENETVAKAVLYDFVVIGEAATNVPLDLQLRYPEIPWRLMSDMRNVMVHEYFQVSIQRVWETIEDDLPSVLPLLQNLLKQEEEEKI